MKTDLIWNAAQHCAFTDLTRFGGRWLCCFRESDAHALGRLGTIRLLVSEDGAAWAALAEFSDKAYDLRDPHFSDPGDGRLMLNFTGRAQEGGKYTDDIQSFATFSLNGDAWSEPQPMRAEGYWVWQVRWSEGIAYTWARKIVEGLPYALFKSRDGLVWESVVNLKEGNETALCFLPDKSAIALRRKNQALLGVSRPPYRDWDWHSLGRFAGGPAVLRLTNGSLIAGCRLHGEVPGKKNFMAIAIIDPVTFVVRPVVEFEAAEDCAYPGLVEHEGVLWISHYAGTKSASAIFLTTMPLRDIGLPSDA